VEQTDVHTRLHRVEELVQGAAPLGELEHEHVLVCGVAAAADEVADVRFCELVSGEVGGGHAGGGEAGEEVGQVGRAGVGFHFDADEDVCGGGGGVAVVEGGDGHGVDDGDELGEGAGLLGDGHRDEGFFVFAEGGALRDEAEAVEVHVCAGCDGDEAAGGAGAGVARDPLLEAGEGERARGLHDGARVLEHVLDGGAGLVGGDLDDLVDDLLADAERLLTDGLDGGAVGEEADLAEDDALALAQGLDHGVRIVRLHADDLDVRGDALDVDADAADEPAAADAAEDGLEVLQVRLPQQLHADGALAGDDVRVVEGWDADQAVQLLEARGLCLCRVEVGAVQDDAAAQPAHVLVLDIRGALRHDDGRGDAQVAGRVGDALGVVAGAAGDDALPARLRVQVRHLVVGAAQLEAEDGLQVLALEQHIALQPVAEVGRVRERRLGDNFVDARREDQAQVLPVRQTRPYSRGLRLQSDSGGGITSGYPFGSRNASGIALWALLFWSSDGGLGFAVYSVRLRPVPLGVRGEPTPLSAAPWSGVTGLE
jgi:hypothetical protein